jgi:hypothetical protein
MQQIFIGLTINYRFCVKPCAFFCVSALLLPNGINIKPLIMKKIIVMALVCAASASFVRAQTEKGNMFVGATVGDLSYASQTSDFSFSDGRLRTADQKLTSLEFNPTLGWFVTNHLVFGGGITLKYDHNTVNNTVTGKQITPTLTSNTANDFTLNVGPFLRYYFFNGQPSSTLFFIQGYGNVGVGSGTSSGSGSSPSSSYTSSGKVSNIFSYDAGGSIGITHFIEKNVGLDVAVGYGYVHEKSTNTEQTITTATGGGTTTTNNNYDLARHLNGVSFSAGFHWFLHNKKS